MKIDTKNQYAEPKEIRMKRANTFMKIEKQEKTDRKVLECNVYTKSDVSSLFGMLYLKKSDV